MVTLTNAWLLYLDKKFIIFHVKGRDSMRMCYRTDIKGVEKPDHAISKTGVYAIICNRKRRCLEFLISKYSLSETALGGVTLIIIKTHSAVHADCRLTFI